MKNITRSLAWLTILIALSGCSSQIVKTEQLSKIRKVAIIGLDIQQQKSVSKSELVGMVFKQSPSTQASPALRVESPHAEMMYNDLAEKIQGSLKCKVMPLSELRKNPAYAKYVKEKTEGFQNRPMINDRYNLYSPKGVVDSFAVLTTNPERLKELANALGVDAIAYSTATVNLNNNSALASMVGAGEFKPSASTSVFLLDGHSGEKIYMDSAQGAKVESGEKNTLGVANEDRLNQLAFEATRLAYANAVKSLKVR